jgi:hypothetical protein
VDWVTSGVILLPALDQAVTPAGFVALPISDRPSASAHRSSNVGPRGGPQCRTERAGAASKSHRTFRRWLAAKSATYQPMLNGTDSPAEVEQAITLFFWRRSIQIIGYWTCACAEALHHCTAEAQILAQRREHTWMETRTQAEREAALMADAALYADDQEHQRQAKPSLAAITKLKATTPVGLYAKAAACTAARQAPPASPCHSRRTCWTAPACARCCGQQGRRRNEEVPGVGTHQSSLD